MKEVEKISYEHYCEEHIQYCREMLTQHVNVLSEYLDRIKSLSERIEIEYKVIIKRGGINDKQTG